MKVRVRHDIDDLANDLASSARRGRAEMVKVVRSGIRTGNMVARDFAKQSSGAHGKHYPKAFSAEMHGLRGAFGVALISGEYGPDAAKPQGNMSFEGGSRNQRPHLDLARSADLIGPAFAKEVRDVIDGLFW